MQSFIKHIESQVIAAANLGVVVALPLATDLSAVRARISFYKRSSAGLAEVVAHQNFRPLPFASAQENDEEYLRQLSNARSRQLAREV